MDKPVGAIDGDKLIQYLGDYAHKCLRIPLVVHSVNDHISAIKSGRFSIPELERANRENTNLIIQNTRFLNALYEILALEEGRVKRSGKDIGHCGVIAKMALTASPEASREGWEMKKEAKRGAVH